jgi:hypothetical protein
MSQLSVWDAHQAFGAELTDLLSEAPPLLLLGPLGSGSGMLARELAQRASLAAILDPYAGASQEQLVAQLVRGLVSRHGAIEPERLDEPTREAERSRVELANLYDKDGAEALQIYAGASAQGWNIERAIGSLRDPPLLVLLEAHRLSNPTGVLWELRDLAARDRIRLLLTSRPHQRGALTDARAPFFGDIRILSMPQLDASEWIKIIDRKITPADLEWLLAQARSRSQTMLETLAAWREKSSPRNAWRDAARTRIPQAEELLRLVPTVHEFAPRLLTAIAMNEAPYATIPGARSNRIAKALNVLHSVDLIEQPQPRRWQIADPLLQEALRILATRSLAER